MENEKNGAHTVPTATLYPRAAHTHTARVK